MFYSCFTINRNQAGPDHKASLMPKELKSLIKSIRLVESSLGISTKKPSDSEIENITIVRKSIVAKKNITKGDIFDENNLTVKRPGKGISPMLWDKIIGKKAKKDYVKDEYIRLR